VYICLAGQSSRTGVPLTGNEQKRNSDHRPALSPFDTTFRGRPPHASGYSKYVRSLRVLHVTPYSAEAWAYGGIPRLSDALARGQVRRGHQVTVCATDVRDESSRLPTRSRTRDGVSLRVFPNVSNRLAYRWQLFLPLGLAAYLKRSARDFDVAHLHACRNLPGVIAGRHLHRAGVPYVLAPNGTALRIERRRIAKQLFDAALGTRMLHGASRIIAVSEAEHRQLGTIGVRGDRIRLVPNPIDLEEFEPPPARGAFRRRLGLDSSAPLVLFLGQLTPRKRVDVLVRAFARLVTTNAGVSRLVIVGNDMGAGGSAQRIAREVGVGDRTTFAGLLRGRARLEALTDATVVVYPSQHEVFGLVPLESLLCGTPVIVADDSGCAEVVRAVGGGQTVPVGDVDALTRAIATVLDGSDVWRARAGLAAARVRERYACDRVCERLDDVYREVVASS
jgi:glycosyltransferase involved in cell wall biosynthesis